MKIARQDSHGSALDIYPALALRKKAPTLWAPQPTRNRAVSSAAQAFFPVSVDHPRRSLIFSASSGQIFGQ
jgi:hypothetical protein